MCSPALAIGLVGAGVSAAGSIQQGNAQAAAADYNAQVARNNAIAANRSAAYDASRINERVAKIQGQQRAAYAGAGVSGGTALEVEADTSRQGAMDVQAALYSGNLQANRETASANLSELEARNARIGGVIGAGTTLITGFGKALQFV